MATQHLISVCSWSDFLHHHIVHISMCRLLKYVGASQKFKNVEGVLSSMSLSFVNVSSQLWAPADFEFLKHQFSNYCTNLVFNQYIQR